MKSAFLASFEPKNTSGWTVSHFIQFTMIRSEIINGSNKNNYLTA